MKKIYYLLCIVLIHLNSNAQENQTITELFQNSYKVFKDTRQNNGVYLDALTLYGDLKPGGISANGMGLISLCIADAMKQKTGSGVNWEDNAETLALQTIQKFIEFKQNGKTNGAGLYKRFFDFNTGDNSGSWSAEYSTADNALFAMGLVFCKNYFNSNTNIVNGANEILNNMRFDNAISNSNEIYMVLDQSGNIGSYPTLPFNEYMLVSWIAKEVTPISSPNYNKVQNYWNTYYANASNSTIQHPTYNSFELLSDNNTAFVSSYIPQFCYYLVNYFKNDSNYLTYLNNFKNADKLWFTNNGVSNSYEWGLGAGENPGNGTGYSANKINDNPNKIISPQIIAGFIPINLDSKQNLISLYNNGLGDAVYSLPSDPSKKVLWRFSKIYPFQRCWYIQLVDYSTMLFGLASLQEYLGDNWFNLNNPINNNNLSLTENYITNISYQYNNIKNGIEIFNSKNEFLNIDLYDLQGRKLFGKTTNDGLIFINKHELNSSGVLLINIKSNNRIIKDKMLIY